MYGVGVSGYYGVFSVGCCGIFGLGLYGICLHVLHGHIYGKE